MRDFEHDEQRALDAVDDVRKATGRSMFISYDRKRHQWIAGLNDHGDTPVEFETVDEAIDWLYWYAGAQATP